MVVLDRDVGGRLLRGGADVAGCEGAALGLESDMGLGSGLVFVEVVLLLCGGRGYVVDLSCGGVGGVDWWVSGCWRSESVEGEGGEEAKPGLGEGHG